MNYLHVWADLRDGHTDLQFCDAVHAYLGHLKNKGMLEDYSIARRKFGFGPSDLGEFHIIMMGKDLAQLDSAFNEVATRSGDVERLHVAMYRLVANTQAALYRDFPDPQRQR